MTRSPCIFRICAVLQSVCDPSIEVMCALLHAYALTLRATNAFRSYSCPTSFPATPTSVTTPSMSEAGVTSNALRFVSSAGRRAGVRVPRDRVGRRDQHSRDLDLLLHRKHSCVLVHVRHVDHSPSDGAGFPARSLLDHDAPPRGHIQVERRNWCRHEHGDTRQVGGVGMRGRAELSDLVGRDLVRGVSVPCDAEPEISAVRGGACRRTDPRRRQRDAPASPQVARQSPCRTPSCWAHRCLRAPCS